MQDQEIIGRLKKEHYDKKYHPHNMCFIKAGGYLEWNLLNWQVIMFKGLSFVRIIPTPILYTFHWIRKLSSILTPSSKGKRKVAYDGRKGIYFILHQILFVWDFYRWDSSGHRTINIWRNCILVEYSPIQSYSWDIPRKRQKQHSTAHSNHMNRLNKDLSLIHIWRCRRS